MRWRTRQRLPAIGGEEAGHPGQDTQKPLHGARWRLARVRCPAHTARPGLGVLPNPPVACDWPMAPTVLTRVPRLLQTVSCGRGSRPTRGIAFEKLEKQRAGHCPAPCFCSCFQLSPRRRGELSSAGRQAHAGPLAPWASRMRLAGWAGRPTPVLPCAQASAREQGAIEPHGWVHGVSCAGPSGPAPRRQSRRRGATLLT